MVGWLSAMKSLSNLNSFLTFSILVHAAFFFLFLKSRSQIAVEKIVFLDEIESVVSEGAKKTAKGLGSLSFKNFMPDFTSATDAQKTSGVGTEEQEETGGGIGLKVSPLALYVYRIIDEALGYPQDFVLKDVTGKVNATLAFTEDGKWDKSASTFNSNSRYLRIYIIKLLKEVLKDPIPANKLTTHKKFTLKAQFHFNIFLTPKLNESIGQGPKLFGGHLMFRRDYYSKLPFELQNVNVAGNPTVMGMLNLAWVIGKVVDLLSPNKADVLEKFRLDPDW